MVNKEYIEKLEKYKLATKWSNFIVNSPYKSLGIFILSFFILVPGALFIESKWSPRIWFDEGHPQIQKLNRFESQFGSDTFISLGVYHPDGVFQSHVLDTIKKITDEMWLVKDVIRVESLSNYNMISAEGDEILIDPFLKDSYQVHLNSFLLKISCVQFAVCLLQYGCHSKVDILRY